MHVILYMGYMGPSLASGTFYAQNPEHLNIEIYDEDI